MLAIPEKMAVKNITGGINDTKNGVRASICKIKNANARQVAILTNAIILIAVVISTSKR